MESKVKTLINAVSASKVGPLSWCLPSSREEGVWIHIIRAPARATPTACLVVMLVHSECLWPEHLPLGPASKHCRLGIKELPSVIALTCLPQRDLRFHLSGSLLSIWAPDLDQRCQGNFEPWEAIGWQRQRLFFLGCNPFYIRRESHLLERSPNPVLPQRRIFTTQPIIWYSLPPNCLFNMFPFILKAKPPPLSICAVQKAFSPQLPHPVSNIQHSSGFQPILESHPGLLSTQPVRQLWIQLWLPLQMPSCLLHYSLRGLKNQCPASSACSLVFLWYIFHVPLRLEASFFLLGNNGSLLPPQVKILLLLVSNF